MTTPFNFFQFFIHKVVPNAYPSVTTSPDFRRFDFKRVEIGKNKFVRVICISIFIYLITTIAFDRLREIRYGTAALLTTRTLTFLCVCIYHRRLDMNCSEAIILYFKSCIYRKHRLAQLLLIALYKNNNTFSYR